MNKKLLALAATGLLCATGVSAHDFEVDGIYYNITSNWWDSNTVEVTYQGDNYWDIEEYSGAVSIPATVTYDGQEYSVTSIGNEAFAWCDNLTSVQIPNSVTSIESMAFNSCYNLTYVSIPNSVNSIGAYAFYCCSSLTYLPIPDSVNSIGDYAFDGCSGLTLVVIPNSVTSIGVGAFQYCSNLSSLVVAPGNPVYDSREGCNAIIESASNTLIVGLASSTIPEGVTSIGNNAFQNCYNLPSVDIPNGVTNIGDYAFYGCDGLASVTIPGSVTHIANNAFQYCSNLSSFVVATDNPVYDSREGCNALIESATNTLIAGGALSTIPNGVTSIGSAAFQNCDDLTSIEIPNSVTNIGDYAFYDCDGLTSVAIPNSVTNIGDYAFNDCYGLTSVTISGSVTHIGDNAFQSCYNLSSFVVAADNPVYDSRGECNAIIESATNTLIAGGALSTIPNGVTSIGDNAFWNCSGLTSVTIPNSVTNIGNGAFAYCYDLQSVEIPNSVTTIGARAFAGCQNLESVDIPNGVISIKEQAFSGCSDLTSIVIPNSVTEIEPGAFSNCPSIISVVVAEGNTVYDSRGGCNAIIEKLNNTLIVGCQSTTIPNSVTSIGDYAFSNHTGLTSIDIPNSVKSLGYEAFYNCYNLTSIVIPNSVTSIEGCAFQSCSGLTTITSNIPADKLFSFSEYEYVFDGVDKTNCTLNVPYGAQAAYAYTEGWEDFENIVEMVPPSFDLTVSSAGYATLYLDYTAQIPEGVSVYTANEVEGNLLKMEPVAGVLPANTGVVVKAPAGTYTFTYSDTYAPEISDNLFKGSATYEYVDVASTQTAFVLSKVDGEVGMYPAKLTDGRFLNNANKAYLLLTTKLGVSDEELDTSVGGSQLSLRFDFGGTTGVDNVQTESGADAVIYDLYGRKVNKATTPGFYIINNKKVWVK